jgi:hypothetical protein
MALFNKLLIELSSLFATAGEDTGADVWDASGEWLSAAKLLEATFGLAFSNDSFVVVAFGIEITGAGADGIVETISSSCHCRASSSSVFSRPITPFMRVKISSPFLANSPGGDTAVDGWDAAIEELSIAELLVALLGLASSNGSFLSVVFGIELTGAGADEIVETISSSCHCRASSSSDFSRPITPFMRVKISSPLLAKSGEDTSVDDLEAAGGMSGGGLSDTEVIRSGTITGSVVTVAFDIGLTGDGVDGFVTVTFDIGLTGAGADGIAERISSSCHCRASSSSTFIRSVIALLS